MKTSCRSSKPKHKFLNKEKNNNQKEEVYHFSSYRFSKAFIMLHDIAYKMQIQGIKASTYLRNDAIFLFKDSEAFSKSIDLEQAWGKVSRNN